MPNTYSPIKINTAEILQTLIRFDTSNPPGNERPCIEYINGLLKEGGIETTLVARTPERPNILARLKGEGKAPPLLLYGHVDVVTTEGQKWQQDPFSANIADGFLWGRGALDMKSGVAMLLAAFLQAKVEQTTLPGDVIFCAVSDEEAGGDYGSRFLVNEHADLFRGIKYAIGEFGGFNMSMAGKRMYPIMVAEKQCCWMKVTLRGRGGHGAMPVHHQAMAKLGRLLTRLDQKEFPYHLTPAVSMMLNSIADAMGGITGLAIRALTSPLLAGAIIKALGERGNLFAPLLHNTISPTILKASEKINVIPSEVSAGLDGRLLPGFSLKEMEKEMHNMLGADFEMEVLEHDPGPTSPDMGLFDTLGAILKDFDPEGIPVPFVLSAVTDARFFSKLGIQTYGFTPLQLPDDFSFVNTIHAADERVPVAALDFGTKAVYSVLQKFH